LNVLLNKESLDNLLELYIDGLANLTGLLFWQYDFSKVTRSYLTRIMYKLLTCILMTEFSRASPSSCMLDSLKTCPPVF